MEAERRRGGRANVCACAVTGGSAHSLTCRNIRLLGLPFRVPWPQVRLHRTACGDLPGTDAPGHLRGALCGHVGGDARRAERCIRYRNPGAYGLEPGHGVHPSIYADLEGHLDHALRFEVVRDSTCQGPRRSGVGREDDLSVASSEDNLPRQ